MTTNITTQQNNFESIKHIENNVEFWLARELQSLLGYKRWEDFHKLIQNTQNTDFEGKVDHIRHSPKLITAGKGATREIDDYTLTRFGCYKISMLGNTQECIDSRSYFAIQTRKQEIAENSPLEGWQSQTDGVFGITTKDKLLKYQNLPYNPKLKEKAKALRKAGVLSEVLFWSKVKNKQLLELDFERQKIIGNYIVDFFCPELGMVVEIDGQSHDFKGEYDVGREKYLIDLNLEVLHYTDLEIKKGLDLVMGNLYNYLKSKKKHPILNSPLEEYPQSGGGVPISSYDNQSQFGVQTPRQPAVATPQEGNSTNPKLAKDV